MEVVMPSPHLPPAMATLRLWPHISLAWETLTKAMSSSSTSDLPRVLYELGKGISHEKWCFMVVEGGGRGGLTGEEDSSLLMMMVMMMMMMMMTMRMMMMMMTMMMMMMVLVVVMIVVMIVVVVVLLIIVSNNADLKIMLHFWGIIDLSLGLKNISIMNNIPFEKHVVLSEVRLAYLPPWYSMSIAWRKGIPTHFQNHPITSSIDIHLQGITSNVWDVFLQCRLKWLVCRLPSSGKKLMALKLNVELRVTL